MDQILPIAPAPSILIKDFSNIFDWSALETEINTLSWDNGTNFNASVSKNVMAKLPNIKTLILSECETFAKHICPLDFNFKLKMTSSWVNKMSAGQSHPWHSHPFSVVSGVIFLDDTLENRKLSFKNSLKDAIPPYSVLELDYYTDLNDLAEPTDTLQYHMVLFYSNVLHSVPPLSNFTGCRRTISFNTFWDGQVDFGDTLNSHDFL